MNCQDISKIIKEANDEREALERFLGDRKIQEAMVAKLKIDQLLNVDEAVCAKLFRKWRKYEDGEVVLPLGAINNESRSFSDICWYSHPKGIIAQLPSGNFYLNPTAADIENHDSLFTAPNIVYEDDREFGQISSFDDDLIWAQVAPGGKIYYYHMDGGSKSIRYFDPATNEENYVAQAGSDNWQIVDGALVYIGLDNKIHTFGASKVKSAKLKSLTPDFLINNYIVSSGKDLYFGGVDGIHRNDELYLQPSLEMWDDWAAHPKGIITWRDRKFFFNNEIYICEAPYQRFEDPMDMILPHPDGVFVFDRKQDAWIFKKIDFMAAKQVAANEIRNI